MTDETRLDRRSLLKRTAVVTAGTGALVGAGASPVAATHDYMADNPSEDHVGVRESCSGIVCDLVPNGECGDYLAKCTDDNGDTLLYIDWHGGWKSGYVLEDHLSYC